MALVIYCLSVFAWLLSIGKLSFMAIITTEFLKSFGSPACSELDGGSVSLTHHMDSNLRTFNACSECDGSSESSSCELDPILMTVNATCSDLDGDSESSSCDLDSNLMTVNASYELDGGSNSSSCELDPNPMTFNASSELDGGRDRSSCDLDSNLMTFNASSELDGGSESSSNDHDDDQDPPRLDNPDGPCHLFRNKLEEIDEKTQDLLQIIEEKNRREADLNQTIWQLNQELINEKTACAKNLLHIHEKAELLKIEEVLAKERDSFKKAMERLIEEKQEKERVVKGLEMQNEVLLENMDTMQENLEEFRLQQISKDRKIDDLEDKNETLKMNMAKIQRDLERTKAEKEERERHMKDQEVLAEETNVAVKNLQEELHQIRLDKSRMERNLAEARDMLVRVRKQCSEKTEKMAALEREIEDQKRLQKVASTRDNEEHQKRLEKMTALEIENKSLWKGLEKMEKNYKNQLVEAQAQTKLKEDEAMRLSLELEGQNRALENLQTQNKKLKELVKEKRGVIDSLKREKEVPAAKMVAELERMRKECAEKDERINEQNMLLRTLKAEKDQMSKDLEEMRRICSEMKEQREDKGQMAFIGKGLFAYMNDWNDAAFNVFSEALANGSFTNEESALLHILRAKALAACGHPSDDLAVIADCCMAIDKGLGGWEVHQLRGKHLLQQELFGAAIGDLEIVNRFKRSAETLQALHEAKNKLMIWETQSHHNALGLQQTATKPQILKAYKDLSMKYHPDRHRDKPEVLQNAFEEKFKRITTAKTDLMENQQQWQYEARFQQNGYRRP